MSAAKEYESGVDDEIIADTKQPCCTKRRFQCLTILSIAITFISLVVVVPWVVIGAKNKVKNAATQGVRYGSAWMPLGNKLLATEGAQEFGESVDLSSGGDFLVIGSNAINNERGQVEVRQFSGIDWRLLGSVIPGAEEDENFGQTVQLSKNGKLVIAGGFGANNDNDDTKIPGVVRAYALNERQQKWEQYGSAIYGDKAGDRFGISLSSSSDGKSWIAGADLSPGPNGEENGYSRVYHDIDGEWVQKGSTIPGTNDERSGYAVAMSGDGNTVCVGDRNYKVPDIGMRGRARCFFWNGNDWNKKGRDMVGKYEDGQMGYSLALNYDGNRVAVGDRFGGDNTEGSVAVFELKGVTWSMMGDEQVSVRRGDQSGFKVDLNREGNVFAWTARGYNGDGADTGVVRVARWVNGEWQRMGSDLLGDDAKDYFGESVALNDDGTIVAASANIGSVEYVRTFALS